MSLDKAIAHGKEHRRPYYRSGRFDRTCRPGGDCPWCERNRHHAQKRREARAEATTDKAPEPLTDATQF